MKPVSDSLTSNSAGLPETASTHENSDRTTTSDPVERTDLNFLSEESGISQNKCEAEDQSQLLSSSEPKGNEQSIVQLIDSLSEDIACFSEAVDELESMSENLRSLVRNVVKGDGRPTGPWKDLC